MIVSHGRESAAARRADYQLAAQQIRLDFVDERVGRQIHGVGDGLDAHRSADEHPGDRFQILAVLGVQAHGVDALHLAGRRGRRQA